MGNLRSTSNANGNLTVLERAVQITDDMQAIIDEIGPHFNKCQQAFAPNPNHAIDLLELYRDHEIYISRLESLMDTHQQILASARLLQQKANLAPEFFNAFEACDEILTDMNITKNRFPSFESPKPGF